jgi:hypothetical protein
MKLMRNAFAAGFAVAAISLAACSSQHVGTAGSGSNGGDISSLNGNVAQGDIGSIGMHLTIGNGVSVTQLTWTISNGTNSYTGTVPIGDAGSIEFVAGGIQAGSGYVVALSGADTNSDPCTGTSAAVTVSPGATSSATVIVTCVVPTDAALAADVGTGSLAVDAGVVLVNQPPFLCPGITSFSISPSEVLPPQTATLTSLSTPGGGGSETVLWTTSCAGAAITNPTTPSATFACGSATGNCTVTLTVNLTGIGADGGNVGPVCTGVAFTSFSDTVNCEAGGALSCFAPTPNACPAVAGGKAFCASLQTDAANCGACGNVCPTTAPTCVAGACTLVVAAPTACTTSPCATTGPNSVKCTSNAAGTGVCTPTEAAIVARDIAQGNLTAGQLKTGTGSCYECLNAKSCLDDNTGDVGLECADSPDLGGGTAGSGVTLCLSTLNCIITNDCQGAGGITGTSAIASQEDISLCYCGGNNAGNACQTSGTATNGLCVTQESAGFGFAFSDNKDILQNFGGSSFPSGVANAIFQCAKSNKCTACLN